MTFSYPGKKSEQPVTILESMHGMDVWSGVLKALEGKQRVCVWDKPGFGASDYMFAYQTGEQDYYSVLVDALAEKEKADFAPPYAFVGYYYKFTPIKL